MNHRSLRLLMVEDAADDAELMARSLEREGYALELTVVESEQTLRDALVDGGYDLAVTDHELRGFDSSGALAVLAELAPDLPCLLVSGKVGEEAVGRAMRKGAVDYVPKDNLGRLPAAIERSLSESERRKDRAAAEAALARSGRLFEAVFFNTGDAMLILDDERQVVAANPAAAEMFAMAREELLSRRLENLMPGALPGEAARAWEEFLEAGQLRREAEVLRADGILVATEYTAAANFVPGRHITVMRDIRERRAAEAALRRRSAQQEAIVDLGKQALRDENVDLLMEAATARVAATLGVEIASIMELCDGGREFVVRAQVGLGQTRAEVRVPHVSGTCSQASHTLHQRSSVLVPDYDHETRFDRSPTYVELGVRSGLSVEIPAEGGPFGVLETASAVPRVFETGDLTFLTAVANILADALKRAASENEMRTRALHDSLTGLPNRTLFFDRLSVGLTRAKRLGTHVAVLFFDIDNFKGLNDTLGHRAGDLLLTEVGTRIEQIMREADTVARFGGDEFVVLCEDLDAESEVVVLATRLASAFETPFCFDAEHHHLSASIGVAVSDPDHVDGQDLVRDADIAMYRSKEGGGARYTLATEEMRVAVIDRVRTTHALQIAIENDELLLHYQPIVALAGGELRAVEALVRWQHPQRGLLLPGHFIALAEESELILHLGKWVLRAAARQAALWRAEFGDRAPLPIHVNFSARQLARRELPELVQDVLDEAAVPAADIVLEITESALIEGAPGPLQTLARLKRMGVSIVLDDFGTGYSSLSYLERFPIDLLKIDRAFVSQVEGPGAPAPIVSAIIGMARALAITTIAEGVESAEQAAGVAAMGCELAQGYFFARPGPPEQIADLMYDDAPLRARAAEASTRAPAGADIVWSRLRADTEQARPVADPSTYRESFLEALLAVDSDRADEIVRLALAAEIGPETIDTQIVGAAMIEIGRLWERGDVSVAQGHLATGLASRAAGIVGTRAQLTDRLSDPLPPQTALLANVDGEEHVLGLRMVADMLQSLGVDVRYLGGKVPSVELCAAAAEIAPDLIGLSLTMPGLAPVLEEQTIALRAVCPRALIVLGGQGVSPGLTERTGAKFVEDVEALVDLASSGRLLEPTPVGTVAGAR